MNKEFKEIIDDLIRGIDAIKVAWKNIREHNPDFEQVTEEEWRSKEARCWLHGGTEWEEIVELEKRFDYFSKVSKSEISLASKHYDKWGEYIREEGIYLDFEQSDLIEPEKDEILLSYIHKLAYFVEEHQLRSKKSKRALKSFLFFLRISCRQEEIAFIDHIFPKNMDLYGKRIIRIIRPQVYPVSEELASYIVKELAYKSAYGRSNAQLKAAEALALCWLCLTASRLRLPCSLQMVHAISSSDLLLKGQYPELFIPTIFGKQKIRISFRLSRFLRALIHVSSTTSRNTTILQSSLHDLRRHLNDAIRKVKPSASLGKITFSTFLSYPHQFGEHIRLISQHSHNQ